jgi:antitoxin ParD1/3/4
MSMIDVELTEHFRQFVDAQVASGHFKDASHVLNEGLRLLEQRIGEERERLGQLKALIDVGIQQLDRGEAIELRGEQELRDFIQGLGRQIRERHASTANE